MENGPTENLTDGGPLSIGDGITSPPVQPSTPMHSNEQAQLGRSVNVDVPCVPSGRKLSEKEQKECAVIGTCLLVEIIDEEFSSPLISIQENPSEFQSPKSALPPICQAPSRRIKTIFQSVSSSPTSTLYGNLFKTVFLKQ